MLYVSTRGESPAISFADALLAGLARDGGLYMPERWPVLEGSVIARFKGRPYRDVALEVIRPFVAGSISDADLARLIAEAYSDFGHPDVAPLIELRPGEHLLELFHGPTLAFKDIAMQLLARFMDHVLAERDERVTIVGATSGDTGGAAVEAFRGRDRVDMVILFPAGRVSDVQRRMMTTATEANVHAVAVDGTFDDCQAVVKALFNDHSFRDRVKMTRCKLDQLGTHRQPNRSTISRPRRRSGRPSVPSALPSRPEISAIFSRVTRPLEWDSRSSG